LGFGKGDYPLELSLIAVGDDKVPNTGKHEAHELIQQVEDKQENKPVSYTHCHLLCILITVVEVAPPTKDNRSAAALNTNHIAVYSKHSVLDPNDNNRILEGGLLYTPAVVAPHRITVEGPRLVALTTP